MANWSVILNVLLLVTVVVAMVRMMRASKRDKLKRQRYREELSHKIDIPQDDIIAVRKLRSEEQIECDLEEKLPAMTSVLSTEPESDLPLIAEANQVDAVYKPASMMIFLLAKNGRQLAGYELLQSILAAGLRFGEGQLFHRHQFSNGQGPIVCSLATATETGTFDLQNMGALSVRGLCLFMEASGHATIDAERLRIMIDTAKQLSEALDAHLLDDQRGPWSEKSLARYYETLEIADEIVS